MNLHLRVLFATYLSMSLTLTTRPNVPSPSVAMILSEISQKKDNIVIQSGTSNALMMRFVETKPELFIV